MRLHQYLLNVLLSIFLCLPLLASAATTEQAVKAGFVYNVTKYVVWPSYVANENAFNLCVFGDAKLGGALKGLSGKLVAKKPLVLRRWVQSKSLKTCHMVFVGQGDAKNISSVLSEIKDLPILTISDSPEFIEHGGMVGLIRDGRRVAFEVDLKAVKAAGLNMSAQLLKLAKSVKGLK